MVSTGSNLSTLQCVDLGSGLDSVAGRRLPMKNNDIAHLKQSMTLDLHQGRGLHGTGLTPYLSLSPNSETMKNILSLHHSGVNVLISPGGSFSANLKITPQTATTPQTPMSFLNPKVIPAEAELFAMEFENAKGQLFVKRELEEQMQHVSMPELIRPNNSNLLDISYTSALNSIEHKAVLPVNVLSSLAGRSAETAMSNSGFLASMTQQTPASGTVPLLMQADRGCSSPSSNSFYHEPRSVDSKSSCAENENYRDEGASPAPSSTASISAQGNGVDSHKLERKRARNRDAARKCRQRKLDRIQQLEGKVSDLKENNAKLVQNANDLRKQVADLKEMILQHVQMGCKMHETNNS